MVKQEKKPMTCTYQIATLSAKLSLSLLSKPSLPTSTPVGLQSGEGGPQCLVISCHSKLLLSWPTAQVSDIWLCLNTMWMLSKWFTMKLLLAIRTERMRSWDAWTRSSSFLCWPTSIALLENIEYRITTSSEPVYAASVQLGVICPTCSHSVKHNASRWDRNY